MATVGTIYLDHAATTPLDPRVAEAMREVLETVWGNPSSLHRVGQAARQRIDAARDQVAMLWNCHPREVIFTGSATEGDNMALRGLAWANQHRGKHLVISSIEHEAILNTARQLERQGFEISLVDPDTNGVIQTDSVIAALRPDTTAVSIMWVNNEIGSIAPITDIARECKARKIYTHTDMTQAVAHLPIDLAQLPVDSATCSAHKFYGPKGTGINFVRFGTPIWPLLTGGSHEFDLRASTENIPGIVGTATALQLITDERDLHESHGVACVDALLTALGPHPDWLTKQGILRNGDPAHCVPGIVNLRFAGIEAETLLLKLDLAGVAISTGSACSSGSVEPSHVLTAMGIPLTEALSSLRFSMGWGCTIDGARIAGLLLRRALAQLAPDRYSAFADTPLPDLTPGLGRAFPNCLEVKK